MIWIGAILLLVAQTAWAEEIQKTDVAHKEGVIWLQKVADASRKLSYDGIFVMQVGNRIKTLQVENRSDGEASSSRLLVLDGEQREIRCSRNESVTMVWDDKGKRLDRRLGNRHFPNLLPENVKSLIDHYSMQAGGLDRVAGLECRSLELLPKDRYRWGYVLCADATSGLPLRAVMVDSERQPLVQYAFVIVRKGLATKAAFEPVPVTSPEDLLPVEQGAISVGFLPPGYSKEVSIRRKLPNRNGDVEHWVFSDGLNRISMFVEPAPKGMVSLKGQSSRGMMNLITRKLGTYQVTVLGDTPWPAVEAVAMSLTLN